MPIIRYFASCIFRILNILFKVKLSGVEMCPLMNESADDAIILTRKPNNTVLLLIGFADALVTNSNVRVYHSINHLLCLGLGLL